MTSRNAPMFPNRRRLRTSRLFPAGFMGALALLAPLPAVAGDLEAGGGATTTPAADPPSTAPVINVADVMQIPEIVVTPNRVETPVNEVGSSVTVVTGNDIQKEQKTSIIDALRYVPGLAITRSGGPGTTSLVRMRGADEGSTLVMIDGIKMNDPADARGAFDFDALLSGGVDRIEVLRGPQSALYGSDAAGGVINILTERGRGPLTASASAEYGTYNTFRETASVSGSKGPFNYAVDVSNLHTTGISAVAPPVGIERDGSKNTALKSRFGAQITDNLNVDVVAGWLHLNQAFDPSSTQDGPATQLQDNYFGKIEPKLELFGGRWENIVRITGMRTDRTFEEPTMTPSESAFDGTRYTMEYQSNVKVDRDDVLTVGLDREIEQATSSRINGPTTNNSTTTDSEYAQYLLGLFDRLYITAGLRHDENDLFGGDTTGRVSGAYILKETGTTFRSSWGTAVKAPTLSQLLDPTFGNPNLKQEDTTGWDAGFEQKLFGTMLSAGATYFHNDFTNLIQFADMTFENVGQARAQGVETFLHFKPDSHWNVQANYTYTLPKNLITGADLRRRPRNMVNASVFYTFVQGVEAGLLFRHYGSRYDDDANLHRLPPYSVFDLVAHADITDWFTIYGRMENLTNEQYQELFHYNTPGRSVFAGIIIRY